MGKFRLKIYMSEKAKEKEGPQPQNAARSFFFLNIQSSVGITLQGLVPYVFLLRDHVVIMEGIICVFSQDHMIH